MLSSPILKKNVHDFDKIYWYIVCIIENVMLHLKTLIRSIEQNYKHICITVSKVTQNSYFLTEVQINCLLLASKICPSLMHKPINNMRKGQGAMI